MHTTTRDTYNKSARSLTAHYEEIGAREGDIDLAFTLAGHPENAQVLEIGCGIGREARAILRYTPFYTGIDTSEELITRAKERVPKGIFEVADALTYDYKGPYDIVFAFAALRHLDQIEVTIVIDKIYESLRPGGICYISSNYADEHQYEVRKDDFGEREIHYYNADLLQKHAPTGLKRIQEIQDLVNGQKWFEVVFQKDY